MLSIHWRSMCCDIGLDRVSRQNGNKFIEGNGSYCSSIW